METVLTPAVGVPLPDKVEVFDLAKRADAAARTISGLQSKGYRISFTKEDEMQAANLAGAYAVDPEKASKTVTDSRLAKMRPASLVLVNNILKEFGQNVANDAAELRNLVTNKLLLESDNPDPRVRLKALELLGKISDVGLFAEKTEVTITHQTADELRAKLRDKLNRVIEGEFSEEDEDISTAVEHAPADDFSLDMQVAALDDTYVGDMVYEPATEDELKPHLRIPTVDVDELIGEWDDE